MGTWQSSTFTANYYPFTRISALAVDGDTNGDSSKGSCTHTNCDEANNWWIVDLSRNYNITEVDIYKRRDKARGRLNDFYVGVYVTAPPEDPRPGAYPVCYYHSGTPPEPKITITCDHVMLGRYVIIQFDNHSECLELCEVVVREMK